jgi:large subunit ribosomal protein L15
MAEIQLRAPKGAVKKKRIRGRGQGTGNGGRCGRGDKGQNARSGGGVRLGFEGGQMPLYRRIARRGFSNRRFKREFSVVNVGELEKKFEDGELVNRKSLLEKGLVRKKRLDVKILGEGSISKKLKIDVAKVSKSAFAKITKCGGEVISGAPESKGESTKTESAGGKGTKDSTAKGRAAKGSTAKGRTTQATSSKKKKGSDEQVDENGN